MKIIQRAAPLPALRDGEAPKGFEFCAICQGYQHPRRHQSDWHARSVNTFDPSIEGSDRSRLLATYSRPPRGLEK